MKIKGQIVDILKREIFSGEVTITDGKIYKIERVEHSEQNYILPGFIDAHIHIESSMLVPSEFAIIAIKHGTVATISDPHEIANVLGMQGVQFMIENGNTVPFKFNFGAPSCVPATTFETAGAILDSNDIKELLAKPEIKYLAEMMNYPGVLFDDEEVVKKLKWAKHYNKPVDGHAPGVLGDKISKYIDSGITSDHECCSAEEAKEKLEKGMKILIREGSAAKNFEALIGLLDEHCEHMMFCSDDKHPDELLLGHINTLCKRAVAKGIDVFKVLKVACLNPIQHYNLDVGSLKQGDAADFIVVEDLKDFKTLQTYIDGQLVFDAGKSLIKTQNFEILNNFNCNKKSPKDFQFKSTSKFHRVIEAVDGELITNMSVSADCLKDGEICPDFENDILKMAVVNRYSDQLPAVCLIKNFGLKQGAIASSVAHDSHNIIAVGTSDEELCAAVNLIIENKGGISTVNQYSKTILELPIAGIMSDQNAATVGNKYNELDKIAKQFGSKLSAPFMTLSFMALLVIPKLKLSDKGLFDADKFEFISLDKID
ncbi:Adenine deaminase [Flavobacteriaceae bacterium MAR_2010_188]|nr:Adenine deaminase [Flavobacteriaceae bacterium MAR_2010_188]